MHVLGRKRHSSKKFRSAPGTVASAMLSDKVMDMLLAQWIFPASLLCSNFLATLRSGVLCNLEDGKIKEPSLTYPLSSTPSKTLWCRLRAGYIVAATHQVNSLAPSGKKAVARSYPDWFDWVFQESRIIVTAFIFQGDSSWLMQFVTLRRFSQMPHAGSL